MSTATFTLDNVSCAGSVSRVSQQLIVLTQVATLRFSMSAARAIHRRSLAHVVAAIEHAGHSHADLETPTKDTRS